MKHILLVYPNTIEDYKKHFIVRLDHILSEKTYNITHCASLQDAYNVSSANPRIMAILYDWDHFGFKELHHFADRNKLLPIFALTDKHTSMDMNLKDFDLNLEFLQYHADLVREDTRRIFHAIEAYRKTILPPFTQALFRYIDELNYAFCTPGHLGGTAFQKTPTGALFYDFFGPNLFRADLSISIEELGSLLDHSGPQKEAETFIAHTFGADRSLIVTNGTSTANKIVGMYSATAGDTVIIDRNCHKSLTHLLMMVDVVPIYLKPSRNAYGIIGAIPKSEFSEESIKAKMAKQPLAKNWPKYAVITNSTYDGILYNVQHIQDQLKVQHLHFDSAWVPYTKFHPIYTGKFGMSLCPDKNQVIFETQSTHKLLAAFSQSSMIHVKGSFNEHVLNENYMMHTSTSPFYPLVASAEVSAAMMQGEQGYHLLHEAITIALDFRTEIQKLKKESKGWFYDVWQPKEKLPLGCCPLHPNESWHGFKKIEEDFLFLDPIKVTLLLPGIHEDKLESFGIPASIVEKFLASHGFIVEKTGPYSMLFLFSIGISKAKSMSLLAALNKFKQLFDDNASVKTTLPQLYEEHPEFYKNMRIQTLAEKIHHLIQKHDLPKTMIHAFDILPTAAMTPHQTYQELIRQKTIRCPLKQLKDKVSAVMILPYPPGVPLIMPGEKITEDCIAILDFLLMLDDIGNSLPGFETAIHGVEVDENGERYVEVLNR